MVRVDAREDMENRALRETRWLLEEWGKWVLDGGMGMPAMRIPRNHKTSRLSDEEALRVDHAVAQLWVNRRSVARAVKTYYLAESMNYRMLGKILRLAPQTARNLVTAGELWIDSWLEENR